MTRNLKERKFSVSGHDLDVDLGSEGVEGSLGCMAVNVQWSATPQEAWRYPTYAPMSYVSPTEIRTNEKITLPAATLSIRHPNELIEMGEVIDPARLAYILTVGWRAYVSALSIEQDHETIRRAITDNDRAMSDPFYATSRKRIATAVVNYFERVNHDDCALVSGYKTSRALVVRSIHYEMPEDDDKIEELRRRIAASYATSRTNNEW